MWRLLVRGQGSTAAGVEMALALAWALVWALVWVVSVVADMGFITAGQSVNQVLCNPKTRQLHSAILSRVHAYLPSTTRLFALGPWP